MARRLLMKEDMSKHPLLREEGMAKPKKPKKPTQSVKPKRITQADCLRRFGDETFSSYYVGESAQHPGQVQIVQYSTRLVGPILPAHARALAAQLIAAAEAIEAES